MTELYTFDEKYLSALQAQDSAVLAHFVSYFGRLLTVKLRGLDNASIEDIRQETLLRVLKGVRDGEVAQPERLGPYALGVCRNLIKERARGIDREAAWEELDLPSPAPGPDEKVEEFEIRSTVAWVLDRLSEKERRILIAVFLDERDKDDICREFNVSREHLRVMIHRALSNVRKSLDH